MNCSFPGSNPWNPKMFLTLEFIDFQFDVCANTRNSNPNNILFINNRKRVCKCQNEMPHKIGNAHSICIYSSSIIVPCILSKNVFATWIVLQLSGFCPLAPFWQPFYIFHENCFVITNQHWRASGNEKYSKIIPIQFMSHHHKIQSNNL